FMCRGDCFVAALLAMPTLSLRAKRSKSPGRLYREGIAAAAGRGGIGIADLERGAHQILDKIALGAVQQVERDLVDHDPDAAMLKDDVVGICLIVESHPVLKTGTAAARHRDPQKSAFLGLLLRL